MLATELGRAVLCPRQGSDGTKKLVKRRPLGGTHTPRPPFGGVCVPVLLAAHLGGCGDTDSPVSGVEMPRLPEAVFERIGTIVLEESEEVINVSPEVDVDEDGSFLIADGRESRVRIYGPQGDLVTQFGREGEGPGEFNTPIRVWRQPDGGLMVVDMSRRFMEFDSSGHRYLKGVTIPAQMLYTADPLSVDYTLVAGLLRGSSDPRPLLHVWDSETESFLHSFFLTPGDSLTRLAARNFGWADFARRGDSIAAISAFTDTLFIFDPVGQELGWVPLPIRDFRRIRSYNPRSSIVELEQWLGELHLLVDVHWLNDGSLLVQYQRPRGADNEWNLLRTTVQGDRIFDLRNTPELLAVNDDRLFFVDPQSLTPNRWAVTRLRE